MKRSYDQLWAIEEVLLRHKHSSKEIEKATRLITRAAKIMDLVVKRYELSSREDE